MAHWSTTLSADTDAWAGQLTALPTREAKRLGSELLAEWIDGTLEPRLVADMHDVAALRALRHSLAWTFSALQEAGIPLAVEALRGMHDAEARRWCWIVPWRLHQDEEVFLTDEPLRLPLLEEAGARCPKREYVLSIVEHAIRDGANAAAHAGAHAARESLAAASRWVTSARAARASTLADYCERLSSYAAPCRVDADGAAARGRDLTRCREEAPGLVERHGRAWHVDIAGMNGRETLVIDVGTGALWSEATR